MKYTNLIRTGGNIADTMKKQRNQYEETEKSIKNKNGRTGRQPNACLFFRYQMVRKRKPISYFTLTFTITFFSSTSVTPGA